VTDLELDVLRLLTEASHASAFRLRVNHLAARLDDIRSALKALSDAGEIELQSSRCRRSAHVRILHPPADHKPTRFTNFWPFPQPQEPTCTTSASLQPAT
jgi:hypothetical protein